MFEPAARRPGTSPDDPRFLDLFVDEPAADFALAGVPYDDSVLGRKGARKGPEAIREAFRFLGSHDTYTGHSLRGTTLFDAGDVAGLPAGDVLAAHDVVAKAIGSLSAPRMVLLGGDHGLTYAHVQALAKKTVGRIGIVVIDAHYDLRGHDIQPSSGTPFRRILEDMPDRLRGTNIVELGIRPFANSAGLADEAARWGIHVRTPADVRAAPQRMADEAVALAGEGVDHLWLSIDIDGLDQSIAAGCSSPGADGLQFHEADAIVRAVAADPRCRGMDLLEVAPDLDPTGNTARTAAQLVASFVSASP